MNLVVLGAIALIVIVGSVERLLWGRLHPGYVRFVARVPIPVEIPMPDLEPVQVRGFDGQGQEAVWTEQEGEVLFRHSGFGSRGRCVGRIVFDQEGRARATWAPRAALAQVLTLAFALAGAGVTGAVSGIDGLVCAGGLAFGVAIVLAASFQGQRRLVRETVYAEVELALMEHLRLIEGE